jgi:glycosyltransferase involved in cell wall biosynthesis
MTALRVLHFAPHHLPLLATSGGIAVHRHAKALADAEQIVAVAILPRSLPTTTTSRGLPDPQPTAGFATYHFGPDATLDDALALARRFRPDLLHYHYTDYRSTVEAIAAELAIPIVYTDHLPLGDPRLLACKPELGPAEAECIRRADRFIVLVAAGERRIAALVPEAASRIRVVGHGVEDRPDIRDVALGRRAHPHVDALFVGRFVVEKGIFDLLAAIPDALRRCPNLRFTLLGRAANQELGPSTDSIPAELRSRVRIIDWSEPAIVERELRAADLVVAPSHFESFGMAVAEAMLFGLPLVLTRTEGLTSIVPPECGRFVPIHDPIALADAIVELADDPDRRLAMGRRAAQHARAQLTWTRVTQAMLAVYRELRAQ